MGVECWVFVVGGWCFGEPNWWLWLAGFFALVQNAERKLRTRTFFMKWLDSTRK
jgi:hypothetical protein